MKKLLSVLLIAAAVALLSATPATAQARTALTVVRTLTNHGLNVSANAADFSWTAGDAVNGNTAPVTGKEILLVHNTDVGAQTITITAAADNYGRSGAITDYSLSADEYAAFWLAPKTLWAGNGTTVNIDVSDAGIELAVVRVP